MIKELSKWIKRIFIVALMLGCICYFAVVYFYKEVFLINTLVVTEI